MPEEMTMVERVARALCIDAGEHPDTPTPYNPNADYIWQFYRKSAVSVIKAMREPTEAMRRAVAKDWGRRTWAQYAEVIDASLKE